MTSRRGSLGKDAPLGAVRRSPAAAEAGGLRVRAGLESSAALARPAPGAVARDSSPPVELDVAAVEQQILEPAARPLDSCLHARDGEAEPGGGFRLRGSLELREHERLPVVGGQPLYERRQALRQLAAQLGRARLVRRRARFGAAGLLRVQLPFRRQLPARGLAVVVDDGVARDPIDPALTRSTWSSSPLER